MKIVGVTQRVVLDEKTGERRDALDQRWIDFLKSCGFIPLLLPNRPAAAKALLERIKPEAILLTGGGDLKAYGGNAPERDRTEFFLIRHCLKKNVPLLGVCRGMQTLQHFYHVKLSPVRGHVSRSQKIRANGSVRIVNSFHRFGTKQTRSPLTAWAFADDGVIKAVRHEKAPVWGIMWHPERFRPFRKQDIRWAKACLSGSVRIS